ncbi:MAG: hypothetical protein AB4057_22645 [Crocosphaera sp.]
MITKSCMYQEKIFKEKEAIASSILSELNLTSQLTVAKVLHQ